MGVKIKHRGQWIDPDEAAALREQERQSQPEPDPLDLEALPPPAADMTLAELGDKFPAVRRYVTAGGQMRSGLKPSEQEIAQAILDRYGEP